MAQLLFQTHFLGPALEQHIPRTADPQIATQQGEVSEQFQLLTKGVRFVDALGCLQKILRSRDH